MLFSITSSEEPGTTLQMFDTLILDELEVCRVEFVMNKMHSKTSTQRKFSHVDIQDDWDKTVGAVYRSLLSYIDQEDVMRDKDYKSLTSSSNRHKVAIYANSRQREFWESILTVVATCNKTLTINRDLSYLYRLSFYNPHHRAKEIACKSHQIKDASLRYFQSSDMEALTVETVWRKLGMLVVSDLQTQGLLSKSRWLLWGFRDFSN